MNPSTIVKPCLEKVIVQGSQTCVFNAKAVSTFNLDFFDAKYWQEQDKVVGQALGRGVTYFVDAPQNEWVLRHYYRGGLIGKLINDSYLYTGRNNTRAAKEFELLIMLEQLNLPAPKAIGYRITRSWLNYRADILTQRIEHAQDLVSILAMKGLSDDIWFNIGRCIGEFHQKGVYHHDLNIHNILLDKDSKVWLIDFDQGDIRQPAQSWATR